MANFKKSYERSLDAKGRLMLPVDYRDTLAACSENGGFILTVIYGRLVAYMPDAWAALSDKLNSITSPNKDVSNFISKTLGLADELIPDAQGRVRISQLLMRAGKITKDIVLVGRGSKFEIWDLKEFEDLELVDVSEKLAELNVHF